MTFFRISKWRVLKGRKGVGVGRMLNQISEFWLLLNGNFASAKDWIIVKIVPLSFRIFPEKKQITVSSRFTPSRPSVRLPLVTYCGFVRQIDLPHNESAFSNCSLLQFLCQRNGDDRKSAPAKEKRRGGICESKSEECRDCKLYLFSKVPLAYSLSAYLIKVFIVFFR